MMIGKTNVAPNIDTTCWPPNPMVLAQLSRSPGATTSPAPIFFPSPCNVQIGMTRPFAKEEGVRNALCPSSQTPCLE